MCLAGTVVASWSLTQEVAGSSPFTVMTIFLSLNSENSLKNLGKIPLYYICIVYYIIIRIQQQNNNFTK